MGKDFGLGVDYQGTLWSWGSNKKGQLGVGDTEDRLNPFPIVALEGKKSRKVFCGNEFCMTIGETNEVKETSVPLITDRVQNSTRTQQITDRNQLKVRNFSYESGES